MHPLIGTTLGEHRVALGELVKTQHKIILATIVALTPELGRPPTPGLVTMTLANREMKDAFPLQGELNYLKKGEVGALVSTVIQNGMATVQAGGAHRGRVILTQAGRNLLEGN